MKKRDPRYEFLSQTNLQPREKALQYGVSVLSDKDLLKILIGSGQKNCPVEKIADNLIKLLDSHDGMPELEKLMSVRGIGMARSSLLAAALEFSRRHYLPSRCRITHPGDIYPHLTHMADRPQEYFLCLSLNGAHEIIRIRVVSVGLVNRTIVHPREVFTGPIADRAAAVIAAHNHPSGSLDVSEEDREVTRRLSEAGKILGIPLLDHVIFSSQGYVSLMESGDSAFSATL